MPRTRRNQKHRHHEEEQSNASTCSSERPAEVPAAAAAAPAAAAPVPEEPVAQPAVEPAAPVEETTPVRKTVVPEPEVSSVASATPSRDNTVSTPTPAAAASCGSECKFAKVLDLVLVVRAVVIGVAVWAAIWALQALQYVREHYPKHFASLSEAVQNGVKRVLALFKVDDARAAAESLVAHPALGVVGSQLREVDGSITGGRVEVELHRAFDDARQEFDKSCPSQLRVQPLRF